MLLALMQENMAHSIPIIDSNYKIREIEYYKEINGRVYLCIYDAKNLITLRAYYDVEKLEFWKGKERSFIQIMSMNGRQLLAKDVY